MDGNDTNCGDTARAVVEAEFDLAAGLLLDETVDSGRVAWVLKQPHVASG
jgi:hypothetical protein